MSRIILPLRVQAGRYNALLTIKNKATSEDRKVRHFEIELPMEDGGTSYIDGKTHPITKNLVICAKPGQIRHTRLPYKCFYLHMIVRDGLLYDTLINMPNFIEIANHDRIRSFLSVYVHAKSKKEKKTSFCSRA